MHRNDLLADVETEAKARGISIDLFVVERVEGIEELRHYDTARLTEAFSRRQ
jgi:hypothetical protein